MSRPIKFVVSGIIFYAAAFVAHAAETPAIVVVEELHESLLAVMKNAEALGFAGRRDFLAPVITESFDLPLIARYSTGRYWRQLNPAQREQLIGAVGRLSVSIYAGRFDDYDGESFRTVSETPAPRGTVLVNTELVKSNGKTVRLNYLMRPTDAGWRIVDVFLKGVYSELAVKRAEYTAVIRRKGVDGLLVAIEDKIASHESGQPK